MSDDSPFSLTYRFRFPDGKEKEFLVRLDRKNGSAIIPERPHYPEWTRLEFKQCGHCPLRKEAHTHCPVAVSIVEIVQFFQDSQSVDQAYVEVETLHRLSKREKTALYPAISSLIGLHMVTSGCPVLEKLRPMARFHLPFADTEETVYRALSMYALAQYFRHKKGDQADWDFEGLKNIYRDINRVNIEFAKRLRNENMSEAMTNALTSLDCFAQEIDFSLSEGMLEEIEVLFEGYLD
jgi:hypothetical protein